MDLFQDDVPVMAQNLSLSQLGSSPEASSELPAEVRLVAAVSRLIDFHQTRSSSGSISIPEVPESAAGNLHLAISLISALGRWELEQGQTLVSIKLLQQILSEDVQAFDEAALEHCILSLSRSREIRYGVQTTEGIAYARTSDTTPLLIFDSSLRQVGLTDNARLFIRVSELKDSWLYSDLDAQRLLAALARRQFGDIPRFCREMLRDLAAKARQISDVSERPAYTDLRDGLIREGVTISGALRDAADLVHKAMQHLFSPPVVSAFDLWKVSNNISYELSNLQAEMENVLQVTESLSRKFVRFLTDAQKAQTVRSPSVGFLELVHSLHSRPDGFLEQLESASTDFVPWSPELAFFSPDLIAGEISLSRLYSQSLPAPPKLSFRQTDQVDDRVEQVHEFLLRNAELIIDSLKVGPKPLEELMSLDGLVYEGGEGLADFTGVYSYPEVFEVGNQSIRVVHQDDLIEVSSENSVLVTSNPILSLEEVADVPS
ncbi:hypothetical protein [Pseudomonas fluorescens]|uniref:hypothetical protein n=1 Tax=Pseudomonas fluorescens TaxID=294 RepID=UPI0012419982|nr:hypothetical protein [Pseudomonas fluorescens]VVN49234.1 hypothetical protein PS639_06278 [Pseudomonas fluorescens]